MKGQIKIVSVAISFFFALAASAQTDTTVSVHHHRHWADFHYPGREFFFQGQALVGFIEAGGRVTAGYRFGQFGIFGGGVGVDVFVASFQSNAGSTDPYGGVYFPIFVHYEGDILKNRVTPFYSVEAGYAFRYDGDHDDYNYINLQPLHQATYPAYHNNGGFTGDLGFGVKLYAPHHVYAAWSLDLDVKQAVDKYANSFTNSIGENIKVSYSSSSFFYIPAIKIAVGF